MALTPAGAIVRGALAGAVGTAAMDVALFIRYKREGGEQSFLEWEFSSGVTWDTAPAPAQIGKRVVEGLLQRELPALWAPVMNNVVHWKFGAVSGAVYGVVAGSLPKAKVRYGLTLGTVVWAGGYVVLPLAGLYKPMWEYDAKTLAKDWSAHLVYGVATAAAFRALARGR